jgi:hypothetical protein
MRRPHYPVNGESSGPHRRGRLSSKYTPYPRYEYNGRPLERLSYERPQDAELRFEHMSRRELAVHQAPRAIEDSNYPKDNMRIPPSTIGDSTRSEARSGTPNSQRYPAGSRRLSDPDQYSGPSREDRDHTEPPPSSLDSLATELCELSRLFQETPS